MRIDQADSQTPRLIYGSLFRKPSYCLRGSKSVVVKSRFLAVGSLKVEAYRIVISRIVIEPVILESIGGRGGKRNVPLPDVGSGIPVRLQQLAIGWISGVQNRHELRRCFQW